MQDYLRVPLEAPDWTSFSVKVIVALQAVAVAWTPSSAVVSQVSVVEFESLRSSPKQLSETEVST